ncbi:MAG: DUF481 domain-containing protein [Myxococcaceae bacterium]
MSIVLVTAAILVLSQTPPDASVADREATDSAEAARRAAEAAERAAAAAERSARVVEEMAKRLEAVTAPKPEPAPTAEPTGWTGAIGLNLIAVTGSADTLTFSTTGAADRRWLDWVLSAKFAAAYGQSRVLEGAAPTVTALSAAGQLRGERVLSGIASAFLLAGAETDHVKSIEYRASGEAGVAINWVERKEGKDTILLFRTDIGARYAYESRFQYYPSPSQLDNVTLVAPSLGIGFRYNLSKEVAIVEEAQAATNIVGDSRTIASSLTKLTAELTEGLSFNTSFQVNFDSAPAAGKVPTDTILSVGVEFAL